MCLSVIHSHFVCNIFRSKTYIIYIYDRLWEVKLRTILNLQLELIVERGERHTVATISRTFTEAIELFACRAWSGYFTPSLSTNLLIEHSCNDIVKYPDEYVR